MFDGIIETAEGVMGSPWIYLVLFAIAAIDAFFPVVPSETLVITAGVFAATNGEPNTILVVMVASLGAFVGDHISYTIGRLGGVRLLALTAEASRSRKATGWAARALAQRGGLILVVARYIPGGRTAVTLTCGTTRFPLRTFSFFDSIAALSWGTYSTLIGYFGGRAFEGDPLHGLLTGLGIAITITVIVELVRHGRAKRSRRPDDVPSTEAPL